MLPSLAFEKQVEIGNSYDKTVEEIEVVCNFTIKESEKLQKLTTSSACFLDLII